MSFGPRVPQADFAAPRLDARASRWIQGLTIFANEHARVRPPGVSCDFDQANYIPETPELQAPLTPEPT